MSKCVQCKKDLGILLEFGGAKLVNADGDFACSDACKQKYEGERNRVLSMNDKEFKSWIGMGEIQ
jgi:Fe-S-cluster-containing dehydrogenase component